MSYYPYYTPDQQQTYYNANGQQQSYYDPNGQASYYGHDASSQAYYDPNAQAYYDQGQYGYQHQNSYYGQQVYQQQYPPSVCSLASIHFSFFFLDRPRLSNR